MAENIKKRERILWMDVLNIIACISVVLLHCSNGPVHEFNGEISLPYYIGMFSHSFALWGVPIFMMLSGANLLGYSGSWKKFYIRRFERTVIPFCLWSIFYYILFFHKIIPADVFVEKFLNGKINGHMWFFIPLFSLYLSMPFLSTFVKNASRRMMMFFVAISFIFVSAFPFVFSLIGISCWNGTMLPMATKYAMYAILGYLIFKQDFFKEQKKLFYVLGVAGAVVQFVTMVWMSSSRFLAYKFFLQYETPCNFFVSVAVFLFVSSVDWSRLCKKSHIKESLVTQIASCTLGVYLFHATTIWLSNRLGLGLVNPYWGWICVYICSLIPILIMKKLKFVKYMVP